MCLTGDELIAQNFHTGNKYNRNLQYTTLHVTARVVNTEREASQRANTILTDSE